MRQYRHPALLLLSLAVFVAGCATTPPMARDEVMQQYDQIARLQTNLRDAKEQGVDYLAPDDYDRAEKLLGAAVEQAQQRDSEAAREAADQGIAALVQARSNADTARDVMQEVLAARDQAMEANAAQRVPDRWEQAEANLREADRLIEQGNLEAAKRRRPQLLNTYSAVELAALKEGVLEDARAALNTAREHDADDQAPKTFNQAQRELNLAVSTLEANREDVDKAHAHAQKAKTLAERANNVAELVKDFGRRDYTREDIVLWYQSQLAQVNQPLDRPIRFDQPNKQVIQSLRSNIAQQVAAADQAQQLAAQREDEIQNLKQTHEQELAQLRQRQEAEIAAFQEQLNQELEAKETIQEELQKTAREIQQRYEKVNAMFSENEANVYRKQDDVLVSVFGFDFPPGSAEIKTDNYSLLDKIARSVKLFGEPEVVIQGHTDNTGSKDGNIALSQARAESVARFLRDTAEIPADRIRVEGYGASKPVATNDTPEGRAENRRVDVLIVNRTQAMRSTDQPQTRVQ